MEEGREGPKEGGKAYLGNLLQDLNSDGTSTCHDLRIIVAVDVFDAIVVRVGESVVLREGGREGGRVGGGVVVGSREIRV